MSRRATDEAMLTYLAGDDAVLAAAGQIWDATGAVTAATSSLTAAQLELATATDSYAAAIRAARIPAQHVERLGAALILRFVRAGTVTEREPHGRRGEDIGNPRSRKDAPHDQQQP